MKDDLAADQAPLSVGALLDEARSALIRLEPSEAQRASESGARIVDIRPLERRVRGRGNRPALNGSTQRRSSRE